MKEREIKNITEASTRSGFRAPEALVFGIFLGVLLAGILAIVASNTGLEWTWEYWGSSDGTYDRSVIFRNFGLFILALIALPLAVWRGWTAHKQAHSANKQTKLAEKGLIIDRYQKGAQMLESDELSVRLAGIYALRELVWSDPEETYLLVLDLLFDFARERSKIRPPDLNALTSEANELRFGPFPPDLEKALEAASALRTGIPNAELLEKAKRWRPDLRGAILTDVVLEDAYLVRAMLTDANLSFAELIDSDFTEADLTGANLNLALLEGAQLKSANIGDAMLIRTDLVHANLEGCDLLGSDLTEANLMEANLHKALCMNAKFENAKLESADMTNSFCFSATFSDANMKDTNLENAYLANSILYCANFTEANLKYTNMTNTDLSGAVFSGATLTGSEFQGATLEDVDLTGTEWTDVTLPNKNKTGLNH